MIASTRVKISAVYHPEPNPVREMPLEEWFYILNPFLSPAGESNSSSSGEEEIVVLFNPRFFFADLSGVRSLFTGESLALAHEGEIMLWTCRREKRVVPRFSDLPDFSPPRISLKDPLPRYPLPAGLPELERAVVNRQVDYYSHRGVRFLDYGHFYIAGLPPLGEGTSLASGVVIRGKETRIGRKVILYPGVYVENSVIGDSCRLLPGTVVRDSELESGVQIGPYAHLRKNTRVRAGGRVGNFVEMKKTLLGRGSKAMHLSYLGDATVGEGVNVGAGTITCNYDGSKKHPTRIGDGAFIGSGSQLVAPVRIEDHAYVAAGSTITTDVPGLSLAIARQRQRIIPRWVLRKKKKERD